MYLNYLNVKALKGQRKVALFVLILFIIVSLIELYLGFYQPDVWYGFLYRKCKLERQITHANDNCDVYYPKEGRINSEF